MSRKPTRTAENSIEKLKELIVKKAGLTCNHFHDIQLLQYQVKRDTTEYLSIQTLNRFFGLIKNDFKPSKATLDVLSRFIGYHTFEEFEMLCQSLVHPEEKQMPLYYLLHTVFSDVEFQTMQEPGLLNITRNICKLVEINPSIAQEVYPLMAACKYGRRYFFEHFVNIDALNTHYGQGLQYYLMHAKHREQKFFANTLFCKRYLLTSEYHLFKKYYLEACEYSFTEVKTFHSFLLGSYYAIRFYNSKICNDLVLSVDDALSQISHLSKNEGVYGAFPWAEYIIGESLILIEEFYEASKVLEAGSSRLRQMPSGLDKGFETQYELLLLYARFFAGLVSEKKASEHLKAIDKRPLFFLSKNYFSFFIFHLTKMLSSGMQAEGSSEQIKKIIEKTGFKHFQKLIAKPTSASARING